MASKSQAGLASKRLRSCYQAGARLDWILKRSRDLQIGQRRDQEIKASKPDTGETMGSQDQQRKLPAHLFVCLRDNWGQRDPKSATLQTKYLRSATAAIHSMCMPVHTFTYPTGSVYQQLEWSRRYWGFTHLGAINWGH